MFTFCYFQLKCNNCPSWIHLTCNDLLVSLQEAAQVYSSATSASPLKNQQRNQKSSILSKEEWADKKLAYCHPLPLIRLPSVIFR